MSISLGPTDNTMRANFSLGQQHHLEMICRMEPKGFRALSWVNRHFRESALKAVLSFVNEKKFGAKEWAHYVGVVGAEPPIPRKYWMLAGTTDALVVMVPKTVNDKPYTLTRLSSLCTTTKEGERAKISVYSNEIKTLHGSTAIKRSYWVVMLRAVLEESYGKTRSVQLEMASIKDGCAPTLLEAATVAVTTRIATRGLFLTRNLWAWAYTLCQEEPIDGRNLLVGYGNATDVDVFMDDYNPSVGVVVCYS